MLIVHVFYFRVNKEESAVSGKTFLVEDVSLARLREDDEQSHVTLASEGDSMLSDLTLTPRVLPEPPKRRSNLNGSTSGDLTDVTLTEEELMLTPRFAVFSCSCYHFVLERNELKLFLSDRASHWTGMACWRKTVKLMHTSTPASNKMVLGRATFIAWTPRSTRVTPTLKLKSATSSGNHALTLTRHPEDQGLDHDPNLGQGQGRGLNLGWGQVHGHPALMLT